jgi:hypothetical protein
MAIFTTPGARCQDLAMAFSVSQRIFWSFIQLAVIVSGYFYKDDINIQNVLEEEVICSFISKPFNHDEILKAIDKVSARSEV